MLKNKINIRKKSIKNIEKYYKSPKWIIFVFDEFTHIDDSHDTLTRCGHDYVVQNFKNINKNKKVLLVGKLNHIMKTYRFLNNSKINVYMSVI
ncbi:MAG: hypothetical protein ACRC4L_01400 [Mycoplasma sp.]